MIINKFLVNNSLDNQIFDKWSEFDKMLRGINKQIIEIKCPKNECFEKILFFVKADKNGLENDMASFRARSYFDTVMESYGKKSFLRQRRFKLAVTACALAGSALGFVVVWLVL